MLELNPDYINQAWIAGIVIVIFVTLIGIGFTLKRKSDERKERERGSP